VKRLAAIVVVIVVVIPIVVVPMILVIPVTFVVRPATFIVIVVRMAPIRTLIGRPSPPSWDPYISGPTPVPISIDPGVARTRDSRPHLIAQRWRRRADVYANLRKGWSGNC
jgi:hypothetical protein